MFPLRIPRPVVNLGAMTGTHNLMQHEATSDRVDNATRHPREGPTFDVVFRGYHRASVDDYIVRLHEWVIASESRAESAARAAADARLEANELHRRLVDLEQNALLSPEAGGAVGERVADIMRASLEAGAEARSTAEVHAARIIEEGEQHAAEVVLSAERRARQLKEHADSTLADAQARSSAMLDEAAQVKAASAQEAGAAAEAILDEARRHREEVEATIQALMEHRATVVDELDRLKDYLAAATGSSASAAAVAAVEGVARPEGHRGGGVDADAVGDSNAVTRHDIDAGVPGLAAPDAPTEEIDEIEETAVDRSGTTEPMETHVGSGRGSPS